MAAAFKFWSFFLNLVQLWLLLLAKNMLLKSVSLIIQANLGDSVGSVPDHCNKADIAIEQVIRIFWFQCAYLHYMVAYFVYSSIMLKNMHPLI